MLTPATRPLHAASSSATHSGWWWINRIRHGNLTSPRGGLTGGPGGVTLASFNRRRMTPEQFIALWKDNPLGERAGAQAWFCDLCDLLGVPKPRDPEHYCFERGAKKTGGGDGWADVWKRACFGWENKKPGRDLDAALKQLLDYSLNLENPPLLVVSDRERIIIHTTFPGYPDAPREIRIEDLIDPAPRELLRWVFTDPEQLKPAKSFKAITEDAAARFAALAEAMRARGEDSQRVAHALVQCLFCLFAEDERLLPDNLFADLLQAADGDTGKARHTLDKLFRAMRGPDGEFGFHDIAWFNGGLFEIIDIPPLTASDLAELRAAARDLDWRDIDPTLFGTLFERGLDPKARAALGAHYTDVETINKLIDPVVTQPLRREWDAAKTVIRAGVGKGGKGGKTKAYQAAQHAYQGFLLRLYEFRVLDAACGSGNFLYLALKALRDLEKRVRVEARDLGLKEPQVMLQTGPHNILGLEINDYAAELARVTVWIGDIQWCRRNGYPHATDPILQALDGIEHRDALLHPDGTEAAWPKADVIVGNPPFLGGSVMRRELGDAYVDTLRHTYAGRVPGGADLVCYWFEKARAHIALGYCHAAGLVATNSIRGGANRKVLERILSSTLLPEDTGERHGEHYLRHPEIHPPAGSRWLQHTTSGSGRGSLQGSAERPKTGDSGVPGLPPASGAGRFETRPHQMDDRGADRPGRRDRDAGEAALAPLRLFAAWSDEPWVNEGAAVRVSLVCFGADTRSALLNGRPAAVIHADLTGEPLEGDGEAVDLTGALALPENAGTAFQGPEKNGAFDIPGEMARSWLTLPNPNGQPNSRVLKPRWNGIDLTRKPQDIWIIDFGTDTPRESAALFEKPFEHVLLRVKPERDKNQDNNRRINWWRFGRTGEDVRSALQGLPRYIATPEVAKYRVFVWMDKAILPDKKLIVIARSDDATFGILHSRIHEVWALAVCTWHGVGNDPRYTPTTTFETFPFPEGLTPADTVGRALARPGCSDGPEPDLPPDPGRPPAAPIPPDLADPSRRPAAAAIAQAAFELNRLREAWLNPPEWVDWVITPEEEQAGFPRRPVAKPGHEQDLKPRTLTNLYNQRPAWLAMAHETLDHAVASAYGWDDYTPAMRDAEILRRLLALNRDRARRSGEPDP